MTLHNFIKTNREAIDKYIRFACPNIGRLNDTERARWVQNDEDLYLWAKREGVNV